MRRLSSWSSTTRIRLVIVASSRCSTRTGSVNQNVEPCPGLDSTQMRPPCSSMMRLRSAEPNPVPPFFDALDAFGLMKLFEDLLLIGFRYARVPYRPRRRGRRHRGRRPATRPRRFSELDRVSEQVQQHLRGPPLVAPALGADPRGTATFSASFFSAANDSTCGRRCLHDLFIE